MASSHVVNLALNTEHNATVKHERLSYGTQAFERVFIEADFEEAYTDGNNRMDTYITIQAGGENICNYIPLKHLAMISQFEGGTGILSTTEFHVEIDTGTWHLTKGDELLVNIDTPNTTSSANQSLHTTVSAEVGSILPPDPKRYLYRTDTAFMVEGVSKIYVMKNDLGVLDETSGTVEITYGSETISQPIVSLNQMAQADTIGDAKVNLGVLYDGMPRDIQVNNSSGVTLEFVCVVDVKVLPQMLKKAQQFIVSRLNQTTAKERSYMKNK